MDLNKIILITIVILLIVGIFIALGWYLLGSSPAVSDFNTDSEAWLITGDAQTGSSDPTYNESGGVDDSGYISADDDEHGGTWYFEAPEKFLGDKSSYFGGTLEYWLKQSDTSNQFSNDDIVIEGGEDKIVYRFDDNPDTEWTKFSVALDDTADWYLNDHDGEQVDAEDIKRILSDIVSIRIRGEYRTGSDVGGLDSVRLR